MDETGREAVDRVADGEQQGFVEKVRRPRNRVWEEKRARQRDKQREENRRSRLEREAAHMRERNRPAANKQEPKKPKPPARPTHGFESSVDMVRRQRRQIDRMNEQYAVIYNHEGGDLEIFGFSRDANGGVAFLFARYCSDWCVNPRVVTTASLLEQRP